MDAIITKANTESTRIQLKQRGGLRYLDIINPLASAQVFLQGAHVTSFKPHNKNEVLWLSELAVYEQGKAIRGGIPICWPWFGPCQFNLSLPQHGFARTSNFQLINIASIQDDATQLTLELKHSDETIKLWPYQFRFIVTITIGSSLSVELTTESLSDESFSITQAIHSYFSVSDIKRTSITGLESAVYLDQLTGQINAQEEHALKITQETDRIYQSKNAQLKINHETRVISIEQNGDDSTVIWNPWIEKSRRMADFPDSGFNHMICVEAANTKEAYLSKNQFCRLNQSIQV